MDDPMLKIGKYIQVHRLFDFLDPLVAMLFEHFDHPAWDGTLFLLQSYLHEPVSFFKEKYPGKRIICYQLEQLCDGNQWIDIWKLIENLKGADEIWDYDQLNADFLRLHTTLKIDRILPALYTRSLEWNVKEPERPEFDVVFYGTMNEKRWKVFHRLQAEAGGNLRINWFFGTSYVDDKIANSKLVLNLHAFDPWNRQEQIRMFYPIINGRTVVSEPSQENRLGDLVIESSAETMSSVIKSLCRGDEWKNHGLKAKEKFKNMSQSFLESNPWIGKVK